MIQEQTNSFHLKYLEKNLHTYVSFLKYFTQFKFYRVSQYGLGCNKQFWLLGLTTNMKDKLVWGQGTQS